MEGFVVSSAEWFFPRSWGTCDCGIHAESGLRHLVGCKCIGHLNHFFFCPELYRRTREPSSARAFSENPGVASNGSGDAAVGSARWARRRCARSNSERAAPSARVGNRFSAPQIVWNKSNRCAGARGGARVGRPSWLRILTITGGSSIAAMISICRRSSRSVRCQCRRPV
jgi:hypothetical protein